MSGGIGPLFDPQPPMNDPLERNKRNVTAFYDLAFNQSKPAEAIPRKSSGWAWT